MLRRTFPLIRTRLSGLEPKALYTIQLELRVADDHKYKYVNGQWTTHPRNDKNVVSQFYNHPSSPAYGYRWEKEIVSFIKMKLTNSDTSTQPDNVLLKSLNKYQPVVHVYKHDSKNIDLKILAQSIVLTETQFIAVTTYQNQEVKSCSQDLCPHIWFELIIFCSF